MSRSRVRDRARLRAPVETTDPAALAAYAGELRPVVANLRALAEDATAAPSQRVHARAYLRRELLRGIRELEARIDTAAPATSPAS
ncbi:hypothetical protein [Polyangium spumosum]|uniref:Uncharacterized protein n=1 Tax=Polyangium spumosum TaxID=889282 RepID=A0A6N7PPH0_9BACT|nr:hypothetical protein [Polyangium spumosum]MRG93883.1 hypothetical protein [Polyangium spumosum]